MYLIHGHGCISCVGWLCSCSFDEVCILVINVVRVILPKAGLALRAFCLIQCQVVDVVRGKEIVAWNALLIVHMWAWYALFFAICSLIFYLLIMGNAL